MVIQAVLVAVLSMVNDSSIIYYEEDIFNADDDIHYIVGISARMEELGEA